MKIGRRMRRLVSDLRGRSGDWLLGGLSGQLRAALDGAEITRRAAAGMMPTAEARAEMGRIEHEGDRHRAAVVRELGSALTTPMDREDIFRLSRSLDDVVDGLRDYVRETDLYRVTSYQAVVPVVDAIREGLEALEQAVQGVAWHSTRSQGHVLKARKAGNLIRKAYQVEMATLLNGEAEIDPLKRRELLRRLDTVGLMMVDAADALSDGLLKRSH